MKKKTWFNQLEYALKRNRMEKGERRAVINYYNEMFQDKRDDGLSENEILSEFGYPEDVARSVRGADSEKRVEKVARVYDAEETCEYVKSRESNQRVQVKEQGKHRNVVLIILLLPLTLTLALLGFALWFTIIMSGVAVTCAAIASLIFGFYLMTENIGVLIMSVGACLMLSAIGGLICSFGGFLAKYWGKFLKWCFVGKGERR